jgi:hypothetical protein
VLAVGLGIASSPIAMPHMWPEQRIVSLGSGRRDFVSRARASIEQAQAFGLT